MNASPTIGDTPLDSLIAHTMSWEATLVAEVVGLRDCGRLLFARPL